MNGQQLSLFDPAPAARHDHNCVRDGPCKTCGATRPDNYSRGMFLTVPSHECADCNFKTLEEILDAGRRGDRAAYDAAWERHLGRPLRPKRRKARRRKA